MDVLVLGLPSIPHRAQAKPLCSLVICTPVLNHRISNCLHQQNKRDNSRLLLPIYFCTDTRSAAQQQHHAEFLEFCTAPNTREPPWGSSAFGSSTQTTRFPRIQHNPRNASLTLSCKQCQTYKSWEVVVEPLFSQFLPQEPLLAQQALGHPGLLQQGAHAVVAPHRRLRGLPENPLALLEHVLVDLLGRHELTCTQQGHGVTALPARARTQRCSGLQRCNAALLRQLRDTGKGTASSASRTNGWMDKTF